MKKERIFPVLMLLDLQLHADAGTMVNATGNYVNAYTGETQAFEGVNTLNPLLKTYYEKDLLENARVDRVYSQFARKQKLPANHGTTVEWRKWNTFDKASKLQEGVIPTGQKFGESFKTASIEQFGTYTSISDKLELRAFDNVILGATEEMAASFAATEEYLIRKGLMLSTNVLYCDNADGTTPQNTGGMNEGGCYLTDKMVAKAATIMKKNKVPTINGRYYAVLHPSVAHDLRQSEGWIEAHKYAAPEELFSGEIGELHGVRFVMSAEAPVMGDTDYEDATGSPTYQTFFFGKDAFGIIDAEEGGMQMYIKDKEQIGGPLSQFSTIGYKFDFGEAILYEERLLRVVSRSTFSGQDEANG